MMKEISSSAKVSLPKHVLPIQGFENDFYLLNTLSGEYVELDEEAALAIKLCEEPIAVQQIARKIKIEFHKHFFSHTLEETKLLLSLLKNYGLITVENGDCKK